MENMAPQDGKQLQVADPHQCGPAGDPDQPDATERAGGTALAKDNASLEAPRKRRKVGTEAEAQPEPPPVPEHASSSSELAAVDFMSSDEEVHQPGAALGGRFDSSEDEDTPALAGQQHEASAAPPLLPVNASLSEHARQAADIHTGKADSSSSAEVGDDRELLQSKQCLVRAGDVRSSRAALEDSGDSSRSACESSDAAHAAADVGGSSPQGNAGAPEPLAGVSEDIDGEESSEAEHNLPESEPNDSDSEEDASGREEDVPRVLQMQADDEAEPSSPGMQPAALDKGDPGGHSERELPAALQGEGGAPQEDQADQLRVQQEANMLTGVFSSAPLKEHSALAVPSLNYILPGGENF